MVKSCNFYSNQINDKINLLWLLICRDLHLILEEILAQMNCITRVLKLSFCIPVSLPHPPVIITLAEKRE